MYLNIYYQRKSKQIHIWDDENGYQVVPYQHFGFVDSPYGEYTTIFGDSMEKIRLDKTYNNPGVWEADVKPEVNYLIDRYMHEDDPSDKHTMLFYDIEVEKTHKHASPQTAENRITSIATWDNKNSSYQYWVLSPDGHDNPKHVEGLQTFSCEKQLLASFLAFWNELQPTIITGWNIDGYDTPYLYNRLNLLGNQKLANSLSPIGIVDVDTNGKINLAGISSMDYLFLYKKFTFSEEPRYTLDFISKKVVGRGKVEYGGSLQALYETDIDKFIEYNRVDVELVRELDSKLKFIDLALALCHECHVPYEHVWHTSMYLDGAILTYTRRRNLVTPSKKHGDEGGVPGAFVKVPQAGRHRWIYDLDLKSLYPSIIQTLNISPETKIGRVIDWTASDIKKVQHSVSVDFLRGSMEFTSEEFIALMDSEGYSISSNGILYDTKQMGLIPTLLQTWLDERDVAKSEMKVSKAAGNEQRTQYYNTRQLVKKVQANSLYGVLLLPSFRFFDLENGEAVTSTGQSVILFAARVVNKYYNDFLGDTYNDYCIYTDTDSVDGSSLINPMNGVPISISELFNDLVKDNPIYSDPTNREFIFNPDIRIPYYDETNNDVKYGEVEYIERHIVEKDMYEVSLENGKTVIVTEDHSIMVLRDGKLVKETPNNITENDYVISL